MKHKQPTQRTDMSSASDVRFRPYRGEEDIPIIADVGQRCMDADGIEFLWSQEEAARLFAHLDNFDPFMDVLLAEAQDEVVGFVRSHWGQEGEGDRIYNHIGYVLPQWRRNGIGTALLRFAQQRLQSIASGHPSDNPRFLQTWITDTDVASKKMLEADGYQPTRYEFDMLRPLDEPIDDRELPAGLEVRPAKPEHYRQIWEAMDEAFRDHWGHVPASDSHFEWWKKSDSFQPALWKIAWEGDQVAGMVLNFIDKAENQKYGRKRGYTENICVRRPWRRRGLARALLTHSLQRLVHDGMDEACLGVDTQNPSGALHLYESVGYRATKSYTTYRKSLDAISAA